MLVASALALVATSEPPYYSDFYEASVAAPSVVVSRDAPRARFEVRVRAEGVFPGTGSAIAVVRGGSVQPTEDSGFVRVKAGDQPGASSIAFLTSFSTGTRFTFEGNCRELDPSSPCESSFVVTFERESDAGRDGPTEIEWNIDVNFELRNDEDADRGPFPLPWLVEVRPLD